MINCKYCSNKIPEITQICTNCTIGSIKSSNHNSVAYFIQKQWSTQQSKYLNQNVNFLEAIQLAFKQYFDFKGKSSISEYWWWALFRYGGLILLMPLPIGLPLGMAPYMTLLFFMLTLIPDFAIATRRLHDINKSGWWLLIFVWLPTPITILVFKWDHKSEKADGNSYRKNPCESPIDIDTEDIVN